MARRSSETSMGRFGSPTESRAKRMPIMAPVGVNPASAIDAVNAAQAVRRVSVSYTHLTLPTILRV